MTQKTTLRFVTLGALALVPLGALATVKNRHKPRVVCSGFWLRMRAWSLKSRMTPKLIDWIGRTKVPDETFLHSPMPLNSETYLSHVLWVMDNFALMPREAQSSKRIKSEVERPTEGQAFRLVYASLARGFRVDLLQQRLAEYRFHQYPIETMDDFIFYFVDDASVGGRKLSGGESFGLYDSDPRVE